MHTGNTTAAEAPAAHASWHPAPWRRALRGRALSVGIALGGALPLSGCASGINNAEDACAAQRTSAAAFASCLRVNHATLAGGWSAERDLATLYLAKAEYLAGLVAAGQATDAEAMLALAVFRTDTLAKIEGKRREAVAKRVDDAFKQAMEAYEQNKKGSGGTGSGSGQTASNMRNASVARPGW